jgi:hypothetical protein
LRRAGVSNGHGDQSPAGLGGRKGITRIRHAAAILTLAGFMLAFSFGISSDRFQDRKTLVRDEANAIGTAWLRSDFLPEPDRAEAAGLFQKYVDDRLGAAQAQDFTRMEELLVESRRIQHQL